VSASDRYRKPAIAGSGAIACGLAACASSVSKTMLLARSDASAWQAEEQAHSLCAKLDGGDPGKVKVTTKVEDVAECDLIVEAIIEQLDAKVKLLKEIGKACPDADLATTTSSLGVSELGKRSGLGGRIFGLHPFSPVVRMELIELCIPQGVDEEVGRRARDWCEAIGKTVVDVPDEPGFVVNRLLEETGMPPEDVDRCMTLGAGYPMGPLALLDLVGIDVALAIGEAMHADSGAEHHQPPGRLVSLVGEGKLGRKSGAGFYEYERS
jgi:3-hydroxybutyryl-CoA dehydrogenase